MGKSLMRTTDIPATVAPVFGGTAIYNVLLTANLDSLVINLSGTMDVTTTVTGTVGDGIAEIIDSVTLLGDGSDPIAVVPFPELVSGNIWRRISGIAPAINQPLLAVGVNAFSCQGVLDLKAFGALRPKDTALVEQQYRTLQLKFNIHSDFTGAFSGGVVSVAGSSIALDVVAHETVELPDAKGIVSTPSKKALYTSQDINFAGAAAFQRFRLNPGQMLRGISLRAQTSAKVNSDAILSAARIYIGNSLRYNLAAASIVSNNLVGVLAARPTGRYFMNFTEEQGSIERLNNELDLTLASLAGSDAYLEMDIASAGIVRVTQWGHKVLG